MVITYVNSQFDEEQKVSQLLDESMNKKGFVPRRTIRELLKTTSSRFLNNGVSSMHRCDRCLRWFPTKEYKHHRDCGVELVTLTFKCNNGHWGPATQADDPQVILYVVDMTARVTAFAGDHFTIYNRIAIACTSKRVQLFFQKEDTQIELSLPYQLELPPLGGILHKNYILTVKSTLRETQVHIRLISEQMRDMLESINVDFDLDFKINYTLRA